MSALARAFLLLLPLLAIAGGRPGHALAQQPQLNRCTGPGGDTIYTDRPCDSIGASERLPRGAIASAYGLRRGGCARNLQDLVYEITAAIDNRDVNRLGSVYHWIGQSQDSGYRILDRLQAIVDRPLVDIVPLRAAAAQTLAGDVTGEAAAVPAPITPAPIAPPAVAPPTLASTTASPDGIAAPAPTLTAPRTVRRPPVGLRLEQTLGKGSTPSRTVLGLRRHLDCWWVTL